jgi:hypothetical protein
MMVFYAFPSRSVSPRYQLFGVPCRFMAGIDPPWSMDIWRVGRYWGLGSTHAAEMALGAENR